LSWLRCAARVDAQLRRESRYRPLQWCNRFPGFLSCSPPTGADGRFGFLVLSETWNGPMAMLGFLIALATDLPIGQGILAQIGPG
jgi:hypothetical protein